MADPSSPYGFDVLVTDDMDAQGSSGSGVALVAAAIPHRLMADTLPLVGAPGGYVSFGVDVRRWVGEVTTPDLADTKGPELVMVLSRDPRLDPGSIAVQVTIADAGALYDLFITINAQTTTALPIALVVGVTSLTVDILSQGT